MKNLKILFISLLICFAVLLSSCQKDTAGNAAENGTPEQNVSVSFSNGENTIIASSKGCDFTVVRPDTCEKTVTEAASSLCKSIMKITGNLPEIKTDYGTKIDLEILIGETNRSQSGEALEGLGGKDFRISFKDNKLIIIGGSDDATAEAVRYFTDNYISDGVMSFIYGTEYVYTYIAPQILVGGSDIGEFKIYYDGAPQSLVERVNAALFAAIGIELDITNSKEGKYIELVADDSLENGYYMAKVLNDGNIHLQSDTATGLYYSVSCFENAVEKMNVPGEIYELDLSHSGAYPTAFEKFTENDERYFIGQTNKDALSYEIGEEIEFTISLFAGGELASCARFDWTMKGDDGKESSGSEPGINGMLTLKTTLETNGFVMVTVEAIGADGNEIDGDVRFSGAAGVHPELLTITKEEPADFDEYWAEAIAEMMAVEPEIIEMEEIEGKSGYKAYKMKIACAGNDKWTGETYVSGYLTYPENASPKSLDIKASFQGYGVNSPSPSYSGSQISFSVCGHSIEIGQEKSYYSELQNGVLKNHGWSVDENSDPKNVYFRYMILRDLQALRFMKEYFGEDGNGLWDGNTITLSGSSQGGFQVIALAALDKDIDSISAGVPWLCDIGGYTDGKKIKSSFRPDFAEGLGYFDSASFAARITCNVSINAGLGDPLCPPAGVAAMYNALNCPKSLTFGQNKTHSYTPPVGDKFTFSEG
ncbi:MAG: acetylxylan esterase [Clostridia bacterium]|nr:acetylxylan esterase [Clostridia bacterium]